MKGQSDRNAPLPDEMQGRWIDVDNPSGELVIEGGEVRYAGTAVGALTVDLKGSDPTLEDDFQREDITGLGIDPEGDFHAFNAKFASQFIRFEHA